MTARLVGSEASQAAFVFIPRYPVRNRVPSFKSLRRTHLSEIDPKPKLSKVRKPMHLHPEPVAP